MITIRVEVCINGHQQIIPHAVSIDVDEIAGLPFGEVRRYVDDKVKQFITETINYSWAVEKRVLNDRETKSIAA